MSDFPADDMTISTDMASLHQVLEEHEPHLEAHIPPADPYPMRTLSESERLESFAACHDISVEWLAGDGIRLNYTNAKIALPAERAPVFWRYADAWEGVTIMAGKRNAKIPPESRPQDVERAKSIREALQMTKERLIMREMLHARQRAEMKAEIESLQQSQDERVIGR